MTTAFDLAKQLYDLQFGPNGRIALYDLAAKTTDQVQQNAIYAQIDKMGRQYDAVQSGAGNYFTWAYYEAQKWPNGPPSASIGSNYALPANPDYEKLLADTPAVMQSAKTAIQSSSPEARQAAADAAAAQAKQTADTMAAMQAKTDAEIAASREKTQAAADAQAAELAQQKAEQDARAAANAEAARQAQQGLIDAANTATTREAANAQAAKDAQAAQQAEQAKNDALMAQYRAADEKAQAEATQRGIIQAQQDAQAAEAAKNTPEAKFTAALQAWGDDPQNPDTQRAYNNALIAARTADPNAFPDSNPLQVRDGRPGSPSANLTDALRAWGDDPQNPQKAVAYNAAVTAYNATNPDVKSTYIGGGDKEPDSKIVYAQSARDVAAANLREDPSQANKDAYIAANDGYLKLTFTPPDQSKWSDTQKGIYNRLASDAKKNGASDIQAQSDANEQTKSGDWTAAARGTGDIGLMTAQQYGTGYQGWKAQRDATADANGAQRGTGAYNTDYHDWLSSLAATGSLGESAFRASTDKEKADVAKYMSTELVPASIWATMSPEMQQEALRDPSAFYGAINQLSLGATDKGLFQNGTGSVTSLAGLKFGANGTGFDFSGVHTLTHSEAHADREGGAQTFGTLLALGISLVVPGAALALGEALGASGAAAGALGGSIIRGSIASATGGDVLRGAVSGGVAGYLGAAEGAGAASNGSEYAFSDSASMGTALPNADIAGATGLIESAGATGGDAITSGGMEEFGNSTGIPANVGTPVVFDAAGNVVENAASVAAEISGKSFLTQLGETAEGFANRFGDNFMKQFMKNGVFDTKKFLITLGKPVVMQLANGGSLDLQSIAENMFFSATGNALGATFANDLKATGFGQTIGNTASNTLGAAGAGAVVGALSGNDPLNSAIYSGVATGTTGLINNAIGTSTNEMVNTAGSIVAGAAGNAAGAVASGSNASFGSIFLDGAVSGAVNATINHLFPDTPSGNQIGNSASTGTPNAADATLTGGGVSTDTAINMGDGIDDATAEEIAATGQGGNNTPANAESYQTGNYDQTVATAGDTGLINQATETIDDATQAEIDATGQGGGNSPGNVTDHQNDANYDQTVTTNTSGGTTTTGNTTTGGATGGGTVVVGSVGSGTGTGTGSGATSDAFGAPSFGSVFSHYADLTKDRNVNWQSRTFNGG